MREDKISFYAEQYEGRYYLHWSAGLIGDRNEISEQEFNGVNCGQFPPRLLDATEQEIKEVKRLEKVFEGLSTRARNVIEYNAYCRNGFKRASVTRDEIARAFKDGEYLKARNCGFKTRFEIGKWLGFECGERGNSIRRQTRCGCCYVKLESRKEVGDYTLRCVNPKCVKYGSKPEFAIIDNREADVLRETFWKPQKQVP